MTQLRVHLKIGHEPFKLILIVPFPELTELAPHERHFLAGVEYLISHEKAVACKFLFIVSEILVKQALFSVNDLVVRDREDIIF